MESFTEPDGTLWLVFQHEGTSLHNIMYAPLSRHAPGVVFGDSQREGEHDGQREGHVHLVNRPMLTASMGHAPINHQQYDGQHADRQHAHGQHDESTVKTEHALPIEVLQPSKWWWQLREEHGAIRELWRGMLQALTVVHAVNVTHRYIHPTLRTIIIITCVMHNPTTNTQGCQTRKPPFSKTNTQHR